MSRCFFGIPSRLVQHIGVKLDFEPAVVLRLVLRTGEQRPSDRNGQPYDFFHIGKTISRKLKTLSAISQIRLPETACGQNSDRYPRPRLCADLSANVFPCLFRIIRSDRTALRPHKNDKKKPARSFGNSPYLRNSPARPRGPARRNGPDNMPGPPLPRHRNHFIFSSIRSVVFCAFSLTT